MNLTRNESSARSIKIGDAASLEKTFSEKDVMGYAAISGDSNPLHVDEKAAEHSIFKHRIVQGILVSGLISGVLGTILPGPGSIYLEQNIKFKAPVFLGDHIKATVEVIEKLEDKNICKLSTVCTNQNDDVVISGIAVMLLGEA